MTGLVRAELLKIRTTWAWWLLLIISVLFTVTGVVFSAIASFLPQAQNSQVPGLDSVEGLRSVYAAAGQAYIFTLILGILGMTTEYRHMTITPTLLAEPRRGRLVAAKMVAYLFAGFGFALVTIGVSLAIALILIKALGYSLTLPGLDIPLIITGGMLASTLYAIFGLSLGALIRNQVAAIVSALVWIFLGEALLVQLLPQVGRWLPGGAVMAMMDAGASEGKLLPVWAGALLFVAYILFIALAGAMLTERRDIT
jgi:ABC-2 type transport system permease protein